MTEEIVNDKQTQETFATDAAVLRYLLDQGWKISKATLSRHLHTERKLSRRDGIYERSAVEKYARNYLKRTDTGNFVKENVDSLQERKLKHEANYLEERSIRERIRREKEEGKLILAAAVRNEAFTEARELRDAILNVPSRISAQIAALAGGIDQNKIEALMTTELKKALEVLANETISENPQNGLA